MMRFIVLSFLLFSCGQQVARLQQTPSDEFDNSCKENSECAPAPGCCPAPCTYHVINIRELERARKSLSCSPDQSCPVAGSCLAHKYQCVQKRCKIVFLDPAKAR